MSRGDGRCSGILAKIVIKRDGQSIRGKDIDAAHTIVGRQPLDVTDFSRNRALVVA